MKKKIGELVPIKLIKRITRNYGKVGKIMINTKKIKKSNDQKEVLFKDYSKLSTTRSFSMSIMRYNFSD